MKYILALLAFAPLVAQAVCPTPPYRSDQACLIWTAPTQYTDGTPLTGQLSYRVYRDNVVIATTTALFYLDTAPPRGIRSYYVTAVVNSVESAPSGTGTKTVRFAAPTQGAIE